ncbi:MAG TPA: sigma-70 family RNA polymerase sigma factor [Candidatus Saccharimonadales bacterium]|nr:sigma-70 family RNA polymerase sigma factor [Candidatus Saccharimonadales bacterium]
MAAPHTTPDFLTGEAPELLDFINGPQEIPQQQRGISEPPLIEPVIEYTQTEPEPAVRAQLSDAQKALLTDETARWLLNFCRKRTADAEDIAQATIEKFLKSGHHVNPETVRNWLAVTARNTIASDYGSAEKRRTFPGSPETLAGLDVRCEPSASEPIERAEVIAASKQTLAIIMGGLDEVQKKLVREHFVEGKSLHDIATQMGISEHAVHTRITRIRKRAKALASMA